MFGRQDSMNTHNGVLLPKGTPRENLNSNEDRSHSFGYQQDVGVGGGGGVPGKLNLFRPMTTPKSRMNEKNLDLSKGS
jgi:hypothetical protein